MKSCIDDPDFLHLVDDFDILYFSETWQNSDKPFNIQGYESICVPRSESLHSRRGHGGVCLMYKHALKHGITISEICDSGSIWVKLDHSFFGFENDLYICLLYIPPSNSLYYYYNDVGLFDLLEANIQKYSNLGSVGIVGDLNARCGLKSDVLEMNDCLDEFISPSFIDICNDVYDVPQRCSMDKTVNVSGNRLLDICLSSDLRIVNGRLGDDAGTGSFTFMSSKGKSLIDYVIMSSNVFHLIEDFIVHDLYSFSGNVPIQVNFKVGLKPEPAKPNDEDVTNHKLSWSDTKSDAFKVLHP